MTHQEDRGPADCVVGLLADPEAPTKLANRLATTLPGRLGAAVRTCREGLYVPVAASRSERPGHVAKRRPGDREC